MKDPFETLHEKTANRPVYLYKYTTGARAAQILQDRKFWFTPIGQLNDLYEFRVEALCLETPESRYRVFAKRLLTEKFAKNWEEALKAAEEMSVDVLEDTYRTFKSGLAAFLEGAFEHSGVTCFSEFRNNQRLWGTYGDNHRGACIEIHAKRGTCRTSNHLSPIIYTAHKLPICPSMLMGENYGVDQFMVSVLLSVKHTDWQEEREWRLVMLANSPQGEERAVQVEREFFSRVILGPRISAPDEEAVRKAAELFDPVLPVYKRKVFEQEAREEYVGFEQIHSLDQFLSWVNGNAAK